MCRCRVEKYRPQKLSDVVGNEDAVQRLRAIAKDGNMPHMILTVIPPCLPSPTFGTHTHQTTSAQHLGCLSQTISHAPACVSTAPYDNHPSLRTTYASPAHAHTTLVALLPHHMQELNNNPLTPLQTCRAHRVSARRLVSWRWRAKCSATHIRRACWSSTPPMSAVLTWFVARLKCLRSTRYCAFVYARVPEHKIAYTLHITGSHVSL
jgi:DNA polymerase III delta prime subunit